MLAHDLSFGADQNLLQAHPRRAVPAQPVPGAVRAGWYGSSAPALPRRQWPRSRHTGLPMLHVMTLRLPVDYQRRGPALPGIAFFAGEGEAGAFSTPVTGDPHADDPFLRDLATATMHPQFVYLTDLLGGGWGLLWLTEPELSGARLAPPADPRDGRSERIRDDGTSAWDEQHPDVDVWLSVRDDPNSGLVPTEPGGDGGYQQPWDDRGTLRPWAEGLSINHLGGTALPCQALPDWLSPYFLEFDELPGCNFGGGQAHLDLQHARFDWAQ